VKVRKQNNLQDQLAQSAVITPIKVIQCH